MQWNYRVVRYTDASGGVQFRVYEAYYDNDDRESEPSSLTEDPVYPLGDTVDELREELEMMRKAFDLPVIDRAEKPLL